MRYATLIDSFQNIHWTISRKKPMRCPFPCYGSREALCFSADTATNLGVKTLIFRVICGSVLGCILLPKEPTFGLFCETDHTPKPFQKHSFCNILVSRNACFLAFEVHEHRVFGGSRVASPLLTGKADWVVNCWNTRTDGLDWKLIINALAYYRLVCRRLKRALNRTA